MSDQSVIRIRGTFIDVVDVTTSSVPRRGVSWLLVSEPGLLGFWRQIPLKTI